jgi:hypothetical protein
MNKLSNFFNKLWVYKMRFKNSLEKLKISTKDHAYELLFIWNSRDWRLGYLKYLTILIPFVVFIKYIRERLYGRNSFALPTMGLLIHEEMIHYQTDVPRDKSEANNINKIKYSREYTLKY